jgi:hypothetical protein
MTHKAANSLLPLGTALAQADTWWRRLPAQQRKPTYHPAELHRVTGIARRHLATALPLLGWHRARHWSRQDGRRVLRVLYAPPGHRVPSPARGRPPISLLDLFRG